MDRLASIELRRYGLWAEHNMPCPVFHDKDERAVYNCGEDIFTPSWKAQEGGYFLVCAPPGWRRWVLSRLVDVL